MKNSLKIVNSDKKITVPGLTSFRYVTNTDWYYLINMESGDDWQLRAIFPNTDRRINGLFLESFDGGINS
jgi:hypothetical protein